MKMRKILGLLLSIAFILSMSAICAGASGKALGIKDGEVDKMYSFGLIRDAHIFEMDSAVTRGEAAYAFDKMVGYNTQVNKKAVPLADVDQNVNETEIYKVYSLGIMPCVYGQSFLPDKAVSYGDLVRAAAKLLGYNEIIVGKDADFNAYLRAMVNGGAIKNVIKTENDSVTWSEFLSFLDTVLEADTYEVVPGENKVTKTGENILTGYMNIYECDGIMTKNDFSSLSDNSAFGNGKVQIGDTILDSGDINTLEMLGFNMQAWYRYDESASGYNELLYMCPNSNKNKTLKVNSYNIDKLTIGELTYLDGTRTKKETFPNGIYVLYNGVAVNDYSGWNIHCENGSVTLIDNNNDGKYDVLSVINYEECVVYSKTIDGLLYDLHSSDRNMDVSDNDIKFYKDGELATYDDIKAYDVVSALKTKDDKIVEIIITTNAISGTISSVAQSTLHGCASEVTIDGTTFYTLESFEKIFNNKIRSNLEGTFYLDFNGNIVGYTKGEESVLYAYVIQATYDANEDDHVYLKLFTQDGSMNTYLLPEKVVLNGTSCKQITQVLDEVKASMVIKYKTNNKGEINWIESAYNNPDNSDYRAVGEQAPEDRLRVTFSTKEDTVTYINAVGMFNDKEKVGNKTIFFKVPKDINEKNPDYFAVGKRNMLTDAQKVNIQTYASSKNAIDNDVCVVFENTNYNASSFPKVVPVGIVEDVYTGLNDENETRTTLKLRGYSGAATLMEYDEGYLNNIRAEKTSVTTEYTVQKGDVIRYLLNAKGNIVYAELLCRLNPDGTLESLNASHGIIDDYCLTTGYVYNRQGSDIAFVNNEPGSGTTRADWHVFNIEKAKIFVYEDNKLRTGTIDDVVAYTSDSGDYSRGVLHLMYGQPQALYIYK